MSECSVCSEKEVISTKYVAVLSKLVYEIQKSSGIFENKEFTYGIEPVKVSMCEYCINDGHQRELKHKIYFHLKFIAGELFMVLCAYVMYLIVAPEQGDFDFVAMRHKYIAGITFLAAAGALVLFPFNFILLLIRWRQLFLFNLDAKSKISESQIEQSIVRILDEIVTLDENAVYSAYLSQYAIDKADRNVFLDKVRTDVSQYHTFPKQPHAIKQNAYDIATDSKDDLVEQMAAEHFNKYCTKQQLVNRINSL